MKKTVSVLKEKSFLIQNSEVSQAYKDIFIYNMMNIIWCYTWLFSIDKHLWYKRRYNSETRVYTSRCIWNNIGRYYVVIADHVYVSSSWERMFCYWNFWACHVHFRKRFLNWFLVQPRKHSVFHKLTFS